MNEWWQDLQPRQRLVIALAAGILLLLLLWTQIWEPLVEARQAERARIAQQQATLAWLDAITPMARGLRGAGVRSTDLGGRSLLGVVDETARAAGLAGQLSRIEPVGENQVRVWLEGAEFRTVMRWLDELTGTRPVLISQLAADRAAGSGRVNVRITLERDA